MPKDQDVFVESKWQSNIVLFSSSFPAVHVLMPVYNAAPFIIKAVKSVMMQDYFHITLIAYIDGSTDESLQLLQEFQKNQKTPHKILIYSNDINQGISHSRNQLLRYSKKYNKNAYILNLDADDRFTSKNFISNVIRQMLKTKADVLLFNFSIIYEDEFQKENSAGLCAEKNKIPDILSVIRRSPNETISYPDMPNLLDFTSLGWTKCYAPHVEIPAASECPFEDFVYMAILLNVKKITALQPDYEPIEYLRRSTSICGQRKARNFIHDIPVQLERFFNIVCEYNNRSSEPLKIKMAQSFVVRKLSQYETTLKHLINTKYGVDFTEETLGNYLKTAASLKEYMTQTLIENAPHTHGILRAKL